VTSLPRQQVLTGSSSHPPPHNTTRGDRRQPRRHQESKTPKMTTRGSRRAYRAGVQGTLAIYSHFIYITNHSHLPPSPNLFPSTENAPTRYPTAPTAHPTRPPQPKHSPLPRLEHQNASTRTRSGARALLPTTRTRRTRPQGRVLRVRDGFPHPRHENANPVSRFRVWDIPAPFPPPSTTQTRRTRPCGRVLRVWNVADTLPAAFTAQT